MCRFRNNNKISNLMKIIHLFIKFIYKCNLFISGRDLNVLIYIRRRIAMCCRKLRKLKEAVKMFRDVSFYIYI